MGYLPCMHWCQLPCMHWCQSCQEKNYTYSLFSGSCSYLNANNLSIKGTTNVQPTSTISQQSPLKTWSQSPLFSIRTTVLATTGRCIELDSVVSVKFSYSNCPIMHTKCLLTALYIFLLVCYLDAKPVFKFSDPVVLSQTVIIITISCLLCFTIFAVVAVYCRKKRTSIQTSQCSGLASTVYIKGFFEQ